MRLGFGCSRIEFLQVFTAIRVIRANLKRLANFEGKYYLFIL